MRRPAAVLTVAAALAGCGGDDQRSASQRAAVAERPVSDAETLLLARLLQQNWQHGGAHLSGEIPVRGVAVRLRGRVDFRSGRGEMTLTEAGDARRYFWTRNAVLAQAARGSGDYLRQAPDPQSDPVHFALRFINLLSAETIDNTENIRDKNPRFVRRERLDGHPVDVFRYGSGGRIVYWVDRGTGLLRQVRADAPDGRLRIGLSRHAPVRILLPSAAG